MRSTMQETPLSIATLVRYGTTVHGSSEVITWTGDGARSATYAEVGRRAAQLAHALRGLGVDGRRPGRHLHVEQPGAPRGLPRGAGDGCGAAPAEHPAVPRPARVHRRPRRRQGRARRRLGAAAAGQGARPAAAGRARGRQRPGRPVGPRGHHGHRARVRGPAGGQPDEFDWVDRTDETDAAAMCYTSGTTGNPKGVAYSHRSIYLHSMQVCMADGFAMGQRDRVLLIVPMFHVLAWGTPYAAMMSRRVAGHAGPVPHPGAAGRPDRDGEADARGWRADRLGRRCWPTWTRRRGTCPRCGTSIVGGSACPRSLMEGLESGTASTSPTRGG